MPSFTEILMLATLAFSVYSFVKQQKADTIIESDRIDQRADMFIAPDTVAPATTESNFKNTDYYQQLITGTLKDGNGHIAGGQYA
jgi:hypothetical protein